MMETNRREKIIMSDSAEMVVGGSTDRSVIFKPLCIDLFEICAMIRFMSEQRCYNSIIAVNLKI
jgi:hypothetical protein